MSLGISQLYRQLMSTVPENHGVKKQPTKQGNAKLSDAPIHSLEEMNRRGVIESMLIAKPDQISIQMPSDNLEQIKMDTYLDNINHQTDMGAWYRSEMLAQTACDRRNALEQGETDSSSQTFSVRCTERQINQPWASSVPPTLHGQKSTMAFSL